MKQSNKSKYKIETICAELMSRVRIAKEHRGRGYVDVRVYLIDGGINDVRYTDEFHPKR